jgi:flagellar basal body rod protein FlgG
MHVSPMIGAALERIEERADDVRRAFTPGAEPLLDDSGRDEVSYPASDPLSVAPPDRLYFVERSVSGEVRYTRDGSFVLRDGVLCSRDGGSILGYSRAGTLGELRCDMLDLALGRVAGVRVGADGSVGYERSVVDPRTGRRDMQRISMGRIALARFAAGTRLGERDDGGLVAIDDAVPRLGVPGEGGFGAVTPARRESSGIDIDRSIDRLRAAYVEFDAMQAVYQAQNGVAKGAVDIIK